MNRKIIGAAFALTLLASAPAFSAPQGYVTVGVGASHADIDCTGTSRCDNTGTAAKVVGGWEFANDFSAEVSYNYLGELKATVPSAEFGDIDASFKGSYWGLGLAWRPQIANNFGAVVRVGAAFVNVKTDVGFSGGSGSTSHSSTHPYIGLGVSYAVTKELALELVWDRTDISVDDGSGGDASSTTDTYTLGATYRF
jgi:opacity protein-like surface antigen